MTFGVIVTEQASQDVSRNVAWWGRERSQEQALRWYDGIRNAFDSLSQNPGRCPLASEHAEFPYELRELNFGLSSRPTHRILFTVVKQTVLVLTVRSAAKDKLHPDDLPLP